ncbi:unnamed protein product [Orchesella dallaii]|uniref:Uncharacterized protein n=1 Tax=Orchesella dallaii TaxID=48710 RepID=A0ABP1RZL9_9HEXA
MTPPQNQAKPSPNPEKVPLTLPRRQQAFPNIPSSAHTPSNSPMTELHRSEAKIRQSFNHLDSSSSSTTGNVRSFGLLGAHHQFTHLRDSLIFNHERLLQHQDEAMEFPPLSAQPPHFNSLNPLDLNTLTATNTTANMNMNFEETPFSVSQSVSVTDRRFLNMANANELAATRKHVGWVDANNTVVTTDQDVALLEALERAREEQNLQENDSNLHQLSDEIENFNVDLPSPPSSRLIPPSAPPEENLILEPIYRNSQERTATNTTTVTTVYAYKNNRAGGKKVETLDDVEEDMPPPLHNHNIIRRVSLEDTINTTGEGKDDGFSYEERLQQVPYPFPPVTPYIHPHLGEVERMDTSQPMEGVDDLVGSGCQVLEPKRNETMLTTPVNSNLRGQEVESGTMSYFFKSVMNKLTTIGQVRPTNSCGGSGDNVSQDRSVNRGSKSDSSYDWDSVAHPSQDMYGPVQAFEYYVHDELDDDFPMFSVSKPVFPNPADLKWPDNVNLRESLPRVYHTFLAVNFKKDPRMWLHKNPMGRRARELLAGQPQLQPQQSQQKVASGDNANPFVTNFGSSPAVGARKSVGSVSLTHPPDLDVKVGVHLVPKIGEEDQEETDLRGVNPELEPVHNEFQFI